MCWDRHRIYFLLKHDSDTVDSVRPHEIVNVPNAVSRNYHPRQLKLLQLLPQVANTNEHTNRERKRETRGKNGIGLLQVRRTEEIVQPMATSIAHGEAGLAGRLLFGFNRKFNLWLKNCTQLSGFCHLPELRWVGDLYFFFKKTNKTKQNHALGPCISVHP